MNQENHAVEELLPENVRMAMVSLGIPPHANSGSQEPSLGLSVVKQRWQDTDDGSAIPVGGRKAWLQVLQLRKSQTRRQGYLRSDLVSEIPRNTKSILGLPLFMVPTTYLHR